MFHSYCGFKPEALATDNILKLYIYEKILHFFYSWMWSDRWFIALGKLVTACLDE